MIMRLPLLLLCLLISACGQKGDLYLPDSTAQDNDETKTEESKDAEENKSGVGQIFTGTSQSCVLPA